eukprot:3934531-Rhodomonas_salina.1
MTRGTAAAGRAACANRASQGMRSVGRRCRTSAFPLVNVPASSASPPSATIAWDWTVRCMYRASHGRRRIPWWAGSCRGMRVIVVRWSMCTVRRQLGR